MGPETAPGTPETVLVTGGAGFIGSRVCAFLLRHGFRVVAYDDLSFGRRDLLPVDPGGRLRFVEGDVRDAVALRRLLGEERPRLVCHLAALHFIPYCNAHPVEAMDVNVNGTRTVLTACREVPPRRVLFASSAAVYPPEGSPFGEEHPAGPIDVYGYTKLVGEELSRLFSLETGVSTVVARFFNAFGPDDTNPHLFPAVIDQLREGDRLRLGNLDPVRDYIHVDDLAAGVVALLEARDAGCQTYNLGSGRGRSVREVVAAFEAALGRSLTIVQDSGLVRQVERAALVASMAKLERATGWRTAIGFEEGVRRLAKSLRAGAA